MTLTFFYGNVIFFTQTPIGKILKLLSEVRPSIFGIFGILWIKIVQSIAQGSKMALPRASLVLNRSDREKL